jgi:hypothetical protein
VLRYALTLDHRVPATYQTSYQQNAALFEQPSARVIEAALRARARYHPCMSGRSFPSPWTVEEPNDCVVVRDANGQALGHFYYEEEPAAPVTGKASARSELENSQDPGQGPFRIFCSANLSLKPISPVANPCCNAT